MELHARPCTPAPSAPEIRPVRRDDFDAILNIHDITVRDHQNREPTFSDSAPRSAKQTGATTQTHKTEHRILVAVCDGEVAGYVAYEREICRFGACNVLVVDISVAPEFRGRGIGSGLLEVVEVSEIGAALLCATVRASNTTAQ